MSNPNGPNSKEPRQTQAMRQKAKQKKATPAQLEKKKLRRLLVGQSSAKVKKAFDLGLRSTDLDTLKGYIWAQLVKVDESVANGTLSEQTAVTTRSKLLDLLRRIHDRLDQGPAIPDELILAIEAIPGLKTETDRPETGE